MKFNFIIARGREHARSLLRRAEFGVLIVLVLALGQAVSFAQPIQASARPDYSKFSLLTSRNIFDQNRGGNNGEPNLPQPKQYDLFTLVGIVVYDQEPYAFLDSNSSRFRKVVHGSEKFADFTISDISPGRVKLSGSNNSQFELHLGMQLRKYEDGSWRPIASPEPMPLTSAQESEVALRRETRVQKEVVTSQPQPGISPLPADALEMATPDAPPPDAPHLLLQPAVKLTRSFYH